MLGMARTKNKDNKPVPAPEPPPPPASNSARQGQTVLNFWVDDSLAEAFEQFIAENYPKARGIKVALFREMFEGFLKSKGYWPPKPAGPPTE